MRNALSPSLLPIILVFSRDSFQLDDHAMGFWARPPVLKPISSWLAETLMEARTPIIIGLAVETPTMDQ